MSDFPGIPKTLPVTVGGSDPLGRCFAEAVDVTRAGGGGLEKIAGVRELHPEIDAYLKQLRPDPAYQFVLMTPLGAYEYWGMNVNGDIFPEIALAHDHLKQNPRDVIRRLEARWVTPHGRRLPPGNYHEFGHKTFLNAKRYLHHVNKNPEIAYGDIVVAVYNPAMHRVEVIVRHDREMAKKVGAQDVIDDIDERKPRQISMGCKVPFDVCTKCGSISKTTRDYCECLLTQRAQILPDGRIVGMVNLFPRFFDLSDVFVPAAKESGVLLKVASAAGTRFFVPHSYFERIGTRPPADAIEVTREGVLVKVAHDKQAEAAKSAEVTKEILPNAGPNVERLTAREPDIPTGLLGGDFEQLVNTLALLGIVLKPHEFQHGALTGAGLGDLASQLSAKRQVFTPATSESALRLSCESYSPNLARLLASLLASRSAFHPHLPARSLQLVVVKSPKLPPKREQVENTPPLQKVAEAYDAYRKALVYLPGLLPQSIDNDPAFYREHYLGELFENSWEKLASGSTEKGLSPPPVSVYLTAAHRDRGGVPSSWDRVLPPHTAARALLGIEDLS